MGALNGDINTMCLKIRRGHAEFEIRPVLKSPGDSGKKSSKKSARPLRRNQYKGYVHYIRICVRTYMYTHVCT